MEHGPKDCEARVMRPLWVASMLLLVLCLSVLFVGYAYSAGRNSTLWYTVGAKTDSIRVRSYLNGKLVLDRSIDVRPGQTFRIDPE